MRTKQYSVKVCEVQIDNEDEFISFFNANYELFKNHLILINGNPTKRVEEFLNNKELKFLVNMKLPRGQNKKSIEKVIQEEKEKHDSYKKQLEAELAKLSNKLQNNLTVLDSLIRSGQELKIDGDLLLLNRVNSGASIVVDGNLIITQIVEGSIRCNGSFMMLKASPKANIVFHDVEVDNSFLKERLNRVELKNNEILITPVLKETNWAL